MCGQVITIGRVFVNLCVLPMIVVLIVEYHSGKKVLNKTEKKGKKLTLFLKTDIINFKFVK